MPRRLTTELLIFFWQKKAQKTCLGGAGGKKATLTRPTRISLLRLLLLSSGCAPCTLFCPYSRRKMAQPYLSDHSQ